MTLFDPVTTAGTAANLCLRLVYLGMAFAFIAADRDSRTSRALAAGLAFFGLDGLVRVVLRALGYWPVDIWLQPLVFLPNNLSSIALAEWVILVIATVESRAWPERCGHWLLRLSQVLNVLFVAMELAWPQVFLDLPESGPPLWLWKSLEIAMNAAFVIPIMILLFRQPDFREKQRVVGMAAATPFFMMTGILPTGLLVVLSTLIGILIFLVGAVRYHVLQGQRSQFLSRFLSPQVRSLVNEQGLMQALHQNQVEISVICCDLRGFTAYSQHNASASVVRLLRDYYDAVGKAAADFNATIKDIAGDGALILLGAPLAEPDHAPRALELARRMREAVMQALAVWNTAEQRVGFGIGIATGTVTVGVIDSSVRLEYAAVGPAVNLAARLCSEAADQEIRVSVRTAELAHGATLDARPALALKGFSEPVANYALT